MSEPTNEVKTSPERKNLIEDPDFLAMLVVLKQKEDKFFIQIWPRIQKFLENLKDDTKEQKTKTIQLIQELEGVCAENVCDASCCARDIMNKIVSEYLGLNPDL